MAHQAQSSSSYTYSWIYHVFLTFRGDDTRYGFTGHLYKALLDKGIKTFIDDEELERGEEIKPTIVKAIQDSRIAIAIFSKNYAYSTFCLEELAEILECLKQKGRLVLPVFYDIDPSDLRRLRNSYGNAIAKHEARFGHNSEKVQKWKLALHDASNLSGWHFKPGHEYEYELIRKITEEVSNKINRIPLHIANYPVGLESQVPRVISLLDVGSNERVIMVGIYGMAGIGKTTIARAVYNLIADQFEGTCYVDDISSKAFKYGLVHLQEILLSELLREKDIKLYDIYRGIPILKSRLCEKKVLMVLDNVDKLEQLQAIAGEPDWFGLGSKIIITTRNKHLLETHGVGRMYEAKLISGKEALELFSWHAFKRNDVNPEYRDISYRAVRYCNGLPLALEIIGSNLFSKKPDEWESALDMYREIPSKTIQEILEVSYNDLDEKEKEIFLDIACFFKGYYLSDVKNILQNGRGFHLEYVIGVLVAKSLIKLEGGYVTMHDLIEDMGKEIVRQQSSKPGKRSRLWFYEDILNVLEDNKGTDEIEVIMLHLPKDKIVLWNGKALKKMKNLKILIIGEGQFSTEPKYLPNSLRVLCWPKYPSSSLPSDFHPDKLVILNMSSSCFLLDKSLKEFKSLTEMDLCKCKFLEQVPDVSGIPNLTNLNLSGCENLIEVHASIGSLSKLRRLTAAGCTKLSIFPNAIKSAFLEDLDLSKCSSLQYFPKTSGVIKNIRHIWLVPDADILALRERMGHSLLCSTLMLQKLEILLQTFGSLVKCEGQDQERVSSSVSSNVRCLTCRDCDLIDGSLSAFLDFFPDLEELDLSYSVLRDKDFSEMIPWFSNLDSLNLTATCITILPECIKECHVLTTLHLDDCKWLEEIRGLPPNIEVLSAKYCISLSEQSTSLLLSQTLHEGGGTRFTLPEASIPEWFDRSKVGQSLSFWFRRKFPKIALCLIFAEDIPVDNLCVSINGIPQSVRFLNLPEVLPSNHTFLFDLQGTYVLGNENGIVFLNDEWNEIEFSVNTNPFGLPSDIGFYVYKQETNTEDVLFLSHIPSRAAFFNFCDGSPCSVDLNDSFERFQFTEYFRAEKMWQEVDAFCERNQDFDVHNCSSLPKGCTLAEMEIPEAPYGQQQHQVDDICESNQQQVQSVSFESLYNQDSFSLSHSSQNSIWSIQVPSKIKILMWKICQKDLPTCDNLSRKKLINSSLCPICETEPETVEHAFLSCPWTQPIWFGCDFQLSSTKVNLVQRFELWLYDQFEQIKRVHPHFGKVSALVGNICWAIWNGRNKFVLEDQPVNPWKALIQAKTMHKAYSGVSLVQMALNDQAFEEVCSTSGSAWDQSNGLQETQHFTSTNQQRKTEGTRSENKAKEPMHDPDSMTSLMDGNASIKFVMEFLNLDTTEECI